MSSERLGGLHQQVDIVENTRLVLATLVDRLHALQRHDEAAVEGSVLLLLPERPALGDLEGDGAALVERLVRLPHALVAEALANAQGAKGHDEIRIVEPRGLRDLGVKRPHRRHQGVRLGLALDELVGARDLRHEPVADRFRIDSGAGDVRSEVALGDQPPREFAQGHGIAHGRRLLEGDARKDDGLEKIVGAGQPVLQPLLPGFFEDEVGERLVGHPEPRGHARFDRPLLQHGRAQRVDGRHLRPFDGRKSFARPGHDLGDRVASARARSSASRRRSLRVVAAFSVKVTAAIWSSLRKPVRTIATMRSTSSVVLPVPAPAEMTKLVPSSDRTRSRIASS